MGSTRRLLGLFVLGGVLSSFAHGTGAAAGAYFTVRRQIPLPRHGGGAGDYLVDLRKEDSRRHLAGVDLATGGNPTRNAGLYFTALSIGTPEEKFYLGVDTGRNDFFLNCISCERCPRKNNNGLKLKLYDPTMSQSSSTVMCTDLFCVTTNGGSVPPGCNTNSKCLYNNGFFVNDQIDYNQVSGDGQTTPTRADIIFGCDEKPTDDLSQAFDGVIGFGPNSSWLSQIVVARKTKRIFSHCLNTREGGGIFAVGNVVQPIVGTTTLVPHTLHYTVNLRSISVAGSTLQPPNTFANVKDTIIDSGTTLSYLPEAVYKNTIVASDFYCVGFQSGKSLHDDRKDTVILGDLVLANKLVVYDLERNVVGWTDYDCSSSIKIKDE